MSRYLLLLIITTPFIVAAIVNSLVAYKLGRTSRFKFVLMTLFWIFVFVGIASAKAIYEFLFSNSLTSTEPLSLFDVIQIAGIVFLLFSVNKQHMKTEKLERRLNDLHQEISIVISNIKK